MANKEKIFQEFLKKKNLKNTKQREEIVKYFLKYQGHICPEDLYLVLKKNTSGNLGFSTVYRTLKLLKECGLATEINFGDGKTIFESQAEKLTHYHCICTNCGKIIEFQLEDIEDIQKTITKKYNFYPSYHKLAIYGICSECK